MSEFSRLTRAAGTVGAATFISRILGYVRDVLIAGYFGTGLFADAFIAAFRIPNLMRRLFGEGSLGIAFVPVISETLTRQGREEAFRLARSGIRILALILVVSVILGVLIAPWITRMVAYGFLDSPEKFGLTVSLTRWMFPYVFFVGMLALCMAVLNVLGHFAAPALAPVLLNLSMIGAMLVAGHMSAEPKVRVYALAFGILIGGLLQLMLQVPVLIRKGFRFLRDASWVHPGMRRVGSLFVPATAGAAVVQINSLVGNLLASFLEGGSVSYLYYADRLVQFPLGLFGISAAIAVLPSFARQAASADFTGLKKTFVFALNAVFFVTLPSMAGLIVLREPIVALLFQRGAFDAAATQMTALALLYYAAGLWAFASLRIVASVFYALQDAVTPVRCAALSMLANLILGLVLMQPMDHAGLALALSLAAILNLAILLISLRRRLGLLGGKQILSSTCKTMLGTAIMALGVWLASGPMRSGNPLIPGGRPIELIAVIGLGVLIYSLIARWLHGGEFKNMLAFLRIRRYKSSSGVDEG
jgi:putative peptidoglycan lipid II flippase